MSTILNLNIQAPLCSFHVPQDAALVHPSVGRCTAKFLHRSNVLTARRQEILQAASFLSPENISSKDCGVSPNKRASRRRQPAGAPPPHNRFLPDQRCSLLKIPQRGEQEVGSPG